MNKFGAFLKQGGVYIEGAFENNGNDSNLIKPIKLSGSYSFNCFPYIPADPCLMFYVKNMNSWQINHNVTNTENVLLCYVMNRWFDSRYNSNSTMYMFPSEMSNKVDYHNQYFIPDGPLRTFND
jgi:hypothetical protein